jgi:uncharacterized protein YjbJ (UPF0337 family)
MADNITKGKLNTINGTARKEPSKLAVRKSLENTGKVEHTVGKVQGPNGKSNSSYDMLSWQLKTLLGQIQQIELHESGDCPCILNTQDPPERCLGKHLLNISTLSRETANMSSQNKDWLLKLSGEANERHEQFKRFICHTEDLPKLTDWARNWRKQYIEPIYYTCEVKPPKETTLNDLPVKTGKVADGLNTTACKLPVDRNVPAGSCNRVDPKN